MFHHIQYILTNILIKISQLEISQLVSMTSLEKLSLVVRSNASHANACQKQQERGAKTQWLNTSVLRIITHPCCSKSLLQMMRQFPWEVAFSVQKTEANEPDSLIDRCALVWSYFAAAGGR